ncbi:sulfite exporter TauE/SafE family protein [Modestobacter marinus]|uniref:sulfite exporter TauE/SafE family protein n=1 Tax=Modestobacter marinus TaxID=477641 RepID=UPI001C96894F|nr:sulfite exporter TauE/SafE family protein [Modestobacter marinus]
MTGWEMLAVAAAGLAAGSINAVVGSGTLVTFPVLLAVGLPPVTASISNSLGLVPGNLTGAIGYRRELRGQRRLLVRLFPASVLGALTGAFLLLHLPAAAFETIVPVLVGLAVVLVATQPMLQRALARRRARDGVTEPDQLRLGPGRLAALLAGAYATGTYGGYFAASQGVLQIGIFGLLLPESLQRLNAIKNVLTFGVNAVAALAYVVVASDRLDWTAAALVAAGSVVGGYLGSTVGRRLPPVVLRTAIVLLGLVAIGVLLSR